MKNLLLILSLFCALSVGAQSQTTYLFIGTYTEGKPGKGIYVYRFDSKTGALKKISNTENITNPSFLTIAPNGHYVYACTETKMPGAGSVAAFAFDSINGKLSFINKQDAGGENPVYVSVYKNNKFVVNANYTGGSVSVFTANENGSLNPHSQLMQFTDSSVNKARQDRAHIHADVFSPQHDYLFFSDLGADKIRAFKFDNEKEKPLLAEDSLLVITVPGSGPRHFTFHPNNKFAYCIEELSGMISVYSYSDFGKLDSIQRVFSYSKKQEVCSGADIHISPDGLFLYASNRGENTISIFFIDKISGKLKLIAHQNTYGDHPRNFVIDSSGNYLLVANQVSGNIVVFKRNSKTGLLVKTKTEIKVQLPSCLQMRAYNK